MPGSSDVRISAWSEAMGLATRTCAAGSKPKARDGFLADERVVVDLGEALVHKHARALRAGSRARGWRAAGRSGNQRRLGRDGIVAHHAADLLHQVVLDGNVLGGAPGRHGDAEDAGLRLASTPNSRLSRMRRTSAGSTARPSLRSSQSSGSTMRRRRRKLSASGRPRRPPGGCRARSRAAVRWRGPGREPCWPGPAPFRSGWRRRCAA